jgi:hypothetical protein
VLGFSISLVCIWNQKECCDNSVFWGRIGMASRSSNRPERQAHHHVPHPPHGSSSSSSSSARNGLSLAQTHLSVEKMNQRERESGREREEEEKKIVCCGEDEPERERESGREREEGKKKNLCAVEKTNQRLRERKKGVKK